MAVAMDSLSQEFENWLRLTILVDFSGRNLCHNVLFVQEQLPTDGKLLYKELETVSCQYKDQREILCPSSGITNCDKFDVTLYTRIIKGKFGNKYDSLVNDLRDARNKLFHTGKKEIPDIEFNLLWKNTTDMLQKHNFDLALVDGLKTSDIFSHKQFLSIATFFHQEVIINMKKEIEGVKKDAEYIRGNMEDIERGIHKKIDESVTWMKKHFTQVIKSTLVNLDVPVTDSGGILKDPQDSEDQDMYDTLTDMEVQNILSDDDIRSLRSKRGMIKIGAGGYGTVYRYTTKDTGFKIAVKTVDLGFRNDKLKKQVYALKQEIEILRKLKHRHIVRYYEMLEDENSVSLLMEYVKGGTIYDLISKQGPLNEKKISEYCQQILQGLAYLHEKEIVHRDLKCANILLDNYICKLADFGLSKEDIRSMSGCKTDCGTTYWQSPESLRAQNYGHKSDIWSFGCTVLEMLNTEPPYRELSRYAALLKITSEGLNPSFPPNTSNHCVEFITVCVKKEPQDRPSARSLLNYKFISKYNVSLSNNMMKVTL